MMRSPILFSLALSFLVLATTPSAVYLFAKSQAITMDETTVVYELPYSGMLPDNPLYFMKEIRDGIMKTTTRDNLRKAQLYLLLSDKEIASTLQLARKGKEQLALETLYKSEKYFSEIPSILADSKKQGVSPSNDFMNTLYQSNAKHREVIMEVMKEMPQANVENFKPALELNKNTHTALEKIR